MLRSLRASAALAAVLAAASLPAPDRLAAQQVAEIEVTPDRLTLGIGQTQKLLAVGFDKRGELLGTVRFAFASADPTVARVRDDGTVEGLTPGLTTIRVSARGGPTFSLPVLVQAQKAGDNVVLDASPIVPGGNAALSGLQFDRPTIGLLPTETARVLPTPLRVDGSTGGDPGPLTWRALTPQLVSVSPDGLIEGLAPGLGSVQVAAEGITAVLRVEVASVPLALSADTLTLEAGERDSVAVFVPSQGGRRVRVRLAWVTSNPAVATVDSGGRIAALAPGDVAITAIAPDQQLGLKVKVLPRAVRLVVSPSPDRGVVLVPLNGTRPLTVRALAADSAVIANPVLTWTVADPTIVAVDERSGRLAGRAAGRTSVTVSYRNFPPATWEVEVFPGDIALTRTRLALRAGEGVRLEAQLLDPAGNPLPQLPEVTWSADKPEVAEVTADGVVTGRVPGRATVTAQTQWGTKAQATVLVHGDLLVSADRGGRHQLYALRFSRPEAFQPLFETGAQSVIQPALSADRLRLVASATVAGPGNYDIVTMDADGRGVQRLTSDTASDTDPRWTPDGRRLVFVSARELGVPQVWIMNADGSGQRALTFGKGGSTSPDVSADGERLVFVSARDGGPRLYELPLAGGEVRRLTTGREREGLPRFLPDGDVVYTVEAGGGRSRVMRLRRGQPPVLLFQAEARITSLAVSPDGTRLVYSTSRILDRAKGRVLGELVVRDLAPGSPAMPIFLQPNEQVSGASF